jgi:hypothetical protein
LTTENNSATSTTELEIPAHQPAPGAEDQKPTPPASDADVQNPEEVTETPEQVEAKQESRRARSNARKAAALAEARAEAKLLREDRDRLTAKLEAQSKAGQETGEPKREDFPDYEAYLRAVTKFDARQEREAAAKTEREAQQGKEKQQQANAGSEKVAKAWAERETTFQAATKDYEEVVQPFADEDLQRLSQQARMSIVESEVGPALLYQLAALAEKNPDEFDRIADLSPVRQIAELGKLESKVSMPAKKTTTAPAPASTTSGGRTASKDLSKMSQEEYEAHRKSQGARWAR